MRDDATTRRRTTTTMKINFQKSIARLIVGETNATTTRPRLTDDEHTNEPCPARSQTSFTTQRRARTIARAEKFNADEVLATIADKWEETENKATVITYAAGATAALWLSSTLVGAINVVPLLPKVMELVGLGYSTWFVYRYVLFKDSRQELVEQVDALIARVSGEEE